jgi:hypothetical protein
MPLPAMPRRLLAATAVMLLASPSAVAEQAEHVLPPISRPLLIEPPDNVRLTNGRITFRWEDSMDPGGYPVVYALRITQQGVIVRDYETERSTVLSLNAAEALIPGDYCWSVAAYNEGGYTSSEFRCFTVMKELPADGGIPDAGTGTDGGPSTGSRDSGTSVSVGPLPPLGTPPQPSSGCTSSPAPGATSLAPVLFMALGLGLWATRRR